MSKTRGLPAVAERDVLAAVLDVCAVLGIRAQRQNTGAALNPKGQMVRFGTPGDADIQGLLPDGRALSVEVKRPGAWPNKVQIARLREVNDSNGVAFWVNDAKVAVEILRFVLVSPHHRVEVSERGDVAITDEPRKS